MVPEEAGSLQVKDTYPASFVLFSQGNQALWQPKSNFGFSKMLSTGQISFLHRILKKDLDNHEQCWHHTHNHFLDFLIASHCTSSPEFIILFNPLKKLAESVVASSCTSRHPFTGK